MQKSAPALVFIRTARSWTWTSEHLQRSQQEDLKDQDQDQDQADLCDTSGWSGGPSHLRTT